MSLYRHFKGRLYRVITQVRIEHTGEVVVVYEPVDNGAVWIRPYEEFFGTVLLDGKPVLRFTPEPELCGRRAHSDLGHPVCTEALCTMSRC